MTHSAKTYCAWLLREVWGKRSNIRQEEQDKLDLFAMPGETALDTCLRITGIPQVGNPPFSDSASEYYRTEAQRILEG